MKKLLKSILISIASIGIISGSTAAVVSCGEKKDSLIDSVDQLVNNLYSYFGEYIKIGGKNYSSSDFIKDMDSGSFILNKTTIDRVDPIYFLQDWKILNSDVASNFDLYSYKNYELINSLNIELTARESSGKQLDPAISSINDFGVLFITVSGIYTGGNEQKFYNSNDGTTPGLHNWINSHINPPFSAIEIVLESSLDIFLQSCLVSICNINKNLNIN